MTDWLKPFLTITPMMAWFFAGIGIPWALVVLPRRDWGDRLTVIGLGLALGPILGTTWLFFLGTFATFSFATALIGTLILAGIGSIFAWRRWRAWQDTSPPESFNDPSPKFKSLTIALVVMMGIALLANAWDTAFWPFLRYDTLWTFGYNPKIFMLEKEIPVSISYYPQLVPLTFTFGELAWGSINDHAARAAIPWFILTSGLAAYLLGWRVYGRRLTGIITAALWLLLPSSLVWSSSGDLEHPMALYFTMATVFFILAWRASHDEDTSTETANRYAIIAGLMLGGAMWTKPTSGSFILGVGLVMGIALVYAYHTQNWTWFRAKFRIALITGLASAPIGGMWYIRNILLGHAWTDLPPSYWQDLAQRSGMQLNWLWTLAMLTGLIILTKTWKRNQQHGFELLLTIMAMILLSIAILPTALSIPDDGWNQATSWALINGFREPHRSMNSLEGILLMIGGLSLIWTGRHLWREQSTESQQALLLSWGIGLPFFVVFFWSFSYHYRLALTILPLIFAPLASLIVVYVIPIFNQNSLRRIALVIIAIFISLPAPVAATYHTTLNTFNDTGIDTDFEKYQYANPALMNLVTSLQNYADQRGRESLKILIPGEDRLPFFFPTWEIDNDTLPTDIDDLRGYDLFINYISDFLWEENNLSPNQVWAWTRLAHVYPLPEPGQNNTADGPNDARIGRVLSLATVTIDDQKDRYTLYRIDVESAYTIIEPEYPLDEVVYGDTIQLLGYDLPSTTLQRNVPFTLKLYWSSTEHGPPDQDYSIYVHLLDPDTGELLHQRDGGLMNGLFPTRFLTDGMFFQDRREWIIPDSVRPGPAILKVGVYAPPNGPRLPTTIESTFVGDGMIIATDIQIE